MLCATGTPALIVMQFTQQQARTLAGVSLGDLRQWRKGIGYLSENSGKAARFSFNDLIALAVVAELTDACGVQIRMLGTGLDSLFRRLVEVPPTQLQGLYAAISHDETYLFTIDEIRKSSFSKSCIVVPVDPLIEKIKLQMLPFSSGPSQTALPFPPHAVKVGT